MGRRFPEGHGPPRAALWDVAGRKQPVVLRGHRDTVNDLAFSPDGGWVVTASTDFTARVWDVVTGQSLATLPGRWFMLDVGWSPDGAFLAVGGDTSGDMSAPDVPAALQSSLDMAKLGGMKDLVPAAEIIATGFKPVPTKP